MINRKLTCRIATPLRLKLYPRILAVHVLWTNVRSWHIYIVHTLLNDPWVHVKTTHSFLGCAVSQFLGDGHRYFAVCQWSADWDSGWIVGSTLCYNPILSLFTYNVAYCRQYIVSTELSGGPLSAWMGVALATDDCITILRIRWHLSPDIRATLKPAITHRRSNTRSSYCIFSLSLLLSPSA